MLDAAPQALASSFWQSLGLRTMTANALAGAGICSLDELAARQESDLWRIPSIGRLGIKEIQRLLLKRAETPHPTPAAFSDGDLIVELIRRGYRIDRPNGDLADA